MQKVGWALISLGLAGVVGYFCYWFFSISEIALGFRIAIALVVIGFAVLLIAVGWDRVRSKRKDDDFKEVKY
jgi:hypothetical protein